MNKTEFIDMCIKKANGDGILLACVEVFKEVIPDDAELDDRKDSKGFYDYMGEYAKKHQKNECYCVTPTLAKELAAKYLNITVKEKKSSQILNLEDFF